MKDGLRPWQPKKFYFPAGSAAGGDQTPAARSLASNLAVYDPLLGKTYSEIGTEARSMHKCQGMAQLLALARAVGRQLPARRIDDCRPAASATSARSSTASTPRIAGLAQFAGARPPRELTSGLAAIADGRAGRAQRNSTPKAIAPTVPPLAGRPARRPRAARRSCARLPIDDGARFEIDFRLRQKEREFQQAIVLANGIRVEALADDGVVVPGQPVQCP